MPAALETQGTPSVLVWKFPNQQSGFITHEDDTHPEINQKFSYTTTTTGTCLYTNYLDEKFINLQQIFNSEIAQIDGFKHECLSEYSNKFAGISRYLLDLRPTTLSLELTVNGTLFYTIITDSLTIYVELVLIRQIVDKANQIFISVFDGLKNLHNFGGSLEKNLDKLKKYLDTFRTANALPH